MSTEGLCDAVLLQIFLLLLYKIRDKVQLTNLDFFFFSNNWYIVDLLGTRYTPILFNGLFNVFLSMLLIKYEAFWVYIVKLLFMISSFL